MATTKRKIFETIDPDILQEATRKRNLQIRLAEMAERRISDPAEREAFLKAESPVLTPDEEAALRDADLLMEVDPKR